MIYFSRIQIKIRCNHNFSNLYGFVQLLVGHLHYEHPRLVNHETRTWWVDLDQKYMQPLMEVSEVTGPGTSICTQCLPYTCPLADMRGKCTTDRSTHLSCRCFMLDKQTETMYYYNNNNMSLIRRSHSSNLLF